MSGPDQLRPVCRLPEWAICLAVGRRDRAVHAEIGRWVLRHACRSSWSASSSRAISCRPSWLANRPACIRSGLMFALLAFGSLFGFLGLLLAVPICRHPGRARRASRSSATRKARSTSGRSLPDRTDETISPITGHPARRAISDFCADSSSSTFRSTPRFGARRFPGQGRRTRAAFTERSMSWPALVGSRVLHVARTRPGSGKSHLAAIWAMKAREPPLRFRRRP